MYRLGLRLVVAVLALGGIGVIGVPAASAEKYAVVLQAGTDTHEGTARALHAFLYAKELKEYGHEVVLIFDGAGTQWAEELSDPESDSPLKALYTEFLQGGSLEIVCDYCANSFGVKDALVKRSRNLVSEYSGHPSIAKWLNNGYQLIII